MNKLLRNPWVVGALLLGMATLWWVQLRGLMLPGAEVATARIETVNAEAAIATAPPAARVATQAPSAAERRPTQLRWNSRPRRDPFAPPPADTDITELAPPTVPQPAYAPLLEAPPPTPTLTALLDTPSAKIAVIDGRLVRVGDAVNGRPVLAIGAGSVALGPTPTTPQPLLLKLPRP